MNNLSNINLQSDEEEQEGEGYLPKYICVKKEMPEEEICESETTFCIDEKTATSNILERMIADPLCCRSPFLKKWPEYHPKSETYFQENAHQFRSAGQHTILNQMCSLRITSEPNIFRQPAIIGTIGPSSTNISSIGELLLAGMNVARVSMAHIDPCSITEPIRNIIEASNHFKTIKDYEIPIAIMMDLKGPEIRTGKIDPTHKNYKTEVFVKQNTIIRLTSDKLFEERCTDKMIYIDYADSFCQMNQGMTIYISDGQIKLKVDSIEPTAIVCLVEVGGVLKSSQKVHIPGLPVVLPTISEYDKECIEFAVKMNIDIIVVSKTRNEEIIKNVKKILAGIQNEDNKILVFAKISNFEGLENIDNILRVSDGIVIQKNDLCLEIFPEKMFVAQKEIIGKCNRVGKPVFCTAQLSLKSSNDISKRTEMNDIEGAIFDGADGIILIRETAIQNQGAQAIAQLSNIMREAEAASMPKPFYFDLVDGQTSPIEPSKAIAMAAVQIADKIQASAILTVTTSGKTAQLLSWFRPRRPVIAITRVGKTARQLNLWRAVLPLHFSAPLLPDWFQDVRARFEYGISYGKACDIITPGDGLVLVSGYRKKSGFTNCIRIVFASFKRNSFVDNVSSYYATIKNNSPVS